MKQIMCPCQIAHGKTSVTGDLSTDDGEEEPPTIDPREMPEFRYRSGDLAGAIQGGVVDLGILAVQALVFFLGAFVAFLRYDVR